MSLYPLIFQPTFHYRIWGGNKLRSFGKNITEENIGESWEISTVPGFVSVVSNGDLKGADLNELVAKYKDKLVGGKVYQYYGDKFPLLIKFLDAATPLSVQVHPDDEYAGKHHNSFGKTEMWYVLDTEPDSEVILGFKKNVDESVFSENIEKNTVESVLRKVHPERGDVIYIPSGRVHAMGKGLSVVEIQQTSDITYRIYDYDRVDKDGKKRELHLQQAKEVSDFSFIEQPFTPYDKKAEEAVVIKSPYFTVSRMVLNGNKKLQDSPQSFRILICVEGSCVIDGTPPVRIAKGQSLLLPAGLKNIELKPEEETILLEVHIE
ncbi:MAG: class I mannose-6-phosphate isomerase [Flavobacteriaceae bacterium]|jgi:mannose-6-phosphate isomerase|nr:class I mannose-6-phosphate isomerase [Flavobacteriaceae bacterium]